jgi:hypothetical protein
MDWKRFDLAEATLEHCDTNATDNWWFHVCHTDNVDALQWAQTFISKSKNRRIFIDLLSDIGLTFSDVKGPKVFCWMLRNKHFLLFSNIFNRICQKACEFKTYGAIKCALNELPPRYISDEFKHYLRKFNSSFDSVQLPIDLINLFNT